MVTGVTYGVLAVGDLYQLPPVGQSPIYISPHTAHALDDFAPNGWQDMKLHELTEIMWQKDVHFAQNLSKIQLAVPQEGSEEDRMLQGCELQVNEDHDCYPKDVTHVLCTKSLLLMNGITKELHHFKGTHMSV